MFSFSFRFLQNVIMCARYILIPICLINIESCMRKWLLFEQIRILCSIYSKSIDDILMHIRMTMEHLYMFNIEMRLFSINNLFHFIVNSLDCRFFLLSFVRNQIWNGLIRICSPILFNINELTDFTA